MRACSQDALGPAPRVPRDATILRHTVTTNSLGVLLDDVEGGRAPNDSKGSVHQHVVVATPDRSAARRAELIQRTRERGAEDARVWNERQIELFERELRETREKVAALEQEDANFS